MNEQLKEYLVTDIVNSMQASLDHEQLDRLKNILYMKIDPYNIDKESFEVAAYDNTNQSVLELFLNTKAIEGKSAKTIARYREMLLPMLEEINKPIKEISTWDLRAYLAQYKERRNVCDNTLDGIRRIISSFFNWLQAENYITENPSSRLYKIKVEKKIKTIIDDEAFEKLNMACTNPRDIAMIDLLYSSGIRVGELNKLNRDDVDMSARILTVHGKGNKQRKVFFNGKTKVRLEKYLETRNDLNPALFVTLRRGHNCKEPKRLSIKAAEVCINRIAKEAGLEHIHPHKFRRTMATNMAKKNVPVNKIAYILGHEKISTTQEYLVNNELDIENTYKMCFG